MSQESLSDLAANDSALHNSDGGPHLVRVSRRGSVNVSSGLPSGALLSAPGGGEGGPHFHSNRHGSIDISIGGLGGQAAPPCVTAASWAPASQPPSARSSRRVLLTIHRVDGLRLPPVDGGNGSQREKVYCVATLAHPLLYLSTQQSVNLTRD